MVLDAEVINRDYYPITKLIGFFSKKITKKKREMTLFMRILIGILFFGFLAFGIPTAVGIITGDYLLNSWEIFLASLWLAIAGVLIDLFEYSIDDFWRNYEKVLVMERKEFNEFKKRLYKRTFSKWYLLLSVVAYIIMFFLMKEIIYEHTMIVIIMVDILMIPAAIMWGIMGYLIFYMFFFMYEVCKKDIKINHFDPDGFGGLSKIGNLPIRVAIFVSSFSLYIPYAFNRLSVIGTPYLLIFILIGMIGLILVILLTFFVPLLPLHNLAENKKQELLKVFGDKLKNRIRHFDKGNGIEIDLEILVSFENYKEIKRMAVWPFDMVTIFNLIGAIIIPIVLFLGSIYL